MSKMTEFTMCAIPAILLCGCLILMAGFDALKDAIDKIKIGR